MSRLTLQELIGAVFSVPFQQLPMLCRALFKNNWFVEQTGVRRIASKDSDLVVLEWDPGVGTFNLESVMMTVGTVSFSPSCPLMPVHCLRKGWCSANVGRVNDRHGGCVLCCPQRSGALEEGQEVVTGHV